MSKIFNLPTQWSWPKPRKITSVPRRCTTNDLASNAIATLMMARQLLPRAQVFWALQRDCR
jgi:hypothetical protein